MGGVVTTVHDPLAWRRSLRGTDLLSEEAKAKFFAPFREQYTYGWMVDSTERGTPQQHHGGSVAGYQTLLVRYPEEDVVIAVLSNDDCEVYGLERRLAEVLGIR